MGNKSARLARTQHGVAVEGRQAATLDAPRAPSAAAAASLPSSTGLLTSLSRGVDIIWHREYGATMCTLKLAPLESEPLLLIAAVAGRASLRLPCRKLLKLSVGVAAFNVPSDARQPFGLFLVGNSAAGDLSSACLEFQTTELRDAVTQLLLTLYMPSVLPTWADTADTFSRFHADESVGCRHLSAPPAASPAGEEDMHVGALESKSDVRTSARTRQLGKDLFSAKRLHAMVDRLTRGYTVLAYTSEGVRMCMLRLDGLQLRLYERKVAADGSSAGMTLLSSASLFSLSRELPGCQTEGLKSRVEAFEPYAFALLFDEGVWELESLSVPARTTLLRALASVRAAATTDAPTTASRAVMQRLQSAEEARLQKERLQKERMASED